MTPRIYYTDLGCREFAAVVTRAFEIGGRPAVVLDRTAFYPTSGGQPFDLGQLAGVDVLDVIDHEGDVAHVLASPLSEGLHVHGAIDWARRFDHMQQHTGQHILSAAFDRLCGNRTTGFHMGTEASSIDLAAEVSPAVIEQGIDAANVVVWEDRPVMVRFAEAEDAGRMGLRKASDRQGELRLVDIEHFDLSACGGTHVAHTGAVGVIAALGSERFRGGTRLSFACGGRALRAYRTSRDAVNGSVRALSVLPADLPAAVARAVTESKELRKTIQRLQASLAAHEGARLASGAPTLGHIRIVAEVLDGWDVNGLKAVALAAAAHDGTAVAVVSPGSPMTIVLARSRSLPIDVNRVMRALIDQFGGRGGGTPDLAQGGGLVGDLATIVAAARARLASSVS